MAPLSGQIVNLFAALLLLIAFAMLAQRRIVTLIHLFASQGAALVGSTVTVAYATGQRHLYYSAAITLVLEPENPSEPALCLMFCGNLEPATFVWPAGRGSRWRILADSAASADHPLERGNVAEAITRPDLSCILAESEP